MKGLIKIKNYIVRIKKIEITDMIVSAESGGDAINSVSDLINTCVDNNIDLSKTFNSKPVFDYCVSELEENINE